MLQACFQLLVMSAPVDRNFMSISVIARKLQNANSTIETSSSN